MKSTKREIDAAVGWAASFQGRDRRFQWVGRDRTGVSRWEGDRDSLRWGARVVSVAGFLSLLAMIPFFVGEKGLAALFIGAVGMVLIAAGAWMKRTYHDLLNLSTAEELARAGGFERVDVERLAIERDLQPRAMLNGEYLYDPQDLLPGTRLLRASKGPAEEALLRPAGSEEVAPEWLLRASGEESEPTPLVQDTCEQPGEAAARLHQHGSLY